MYKLALQSQVRDLFPRNQPIMHQGRYRISPIIWNGCWRASSPGIRVHLKGASDTVAGPLRFISQRRLNCEPLCCVESKLAAPRLDFIELLAGEVAVFSSFSNRPKWGQVRYRPLSAHMCDCESLTYIPLTAVSHRLRSTCYRNLMVYLFNTEISLCAR